MNTKPVVLSDKSNSVEETEHKPGVKCTPEEEKVMTTQTQPVSPAKARQVCCDEEDDTFYDLLKDQEVDTIMGSDLKRRNEDPAIE